MINIPYRDEILGTGSKSTGGKPVIGAMAGLGALSGAINMGTNLFNMFQGSADRRRAQALQERIFEREDTALQRRVADGLQAGLSPLASIGGQGANAGQVVSAPQVSGEMTGIDLAGGMSNMLNAGAGLEANDIRKLELSQTAQQFAETMGLESQKFEESIRQFNAGLKSQEEAAKLLREWQSGENALDRNLQMAIENIKNETQKEAIKKQYEGIKEGIEAQLKIAKDTNDLNDQHFQAKLLQDYILGAINGLTNLANSLGGGLGNLLKMLGKKK